MCLIILHAFISSAEEVVQVCSGWVNLQRLMFTCREISILNPLIEVTQFLVSACGGRDAALFDYEKHSYDG